MTEVRSQKSEDGKTAAFSAIFFLALSALLFGLYSPVTAQQPAKIARIGFLVPGPHSAFSSHVEAFRQGLRELGYSEGKNIAVEYRYATNNFDLLADELVRLKVDVIFTGGVPAVRAVKGATSTIPIVMVTGDAVANGFITSLARPGRNITGLSFLSPEVREKQMELLKETFPKITWIGILLDPGMLNPARTDSVTDRDIARQVGLHAEVLEVRDPEGLEPAFRTAIDRRLGALLIRAHPLFRVNQKKVLDLATKSGLPVMYPWKEFVEAGGLMTYGPSSEDLYRRAASYVDKILKGRKPSDLPVEQPTKFELVINLKTAKQIGLTIPPSVLYRADKIIR